MFRMFITTIMSSIMCCMQVYSLWTTTLLISRCSSQSEAFCYTTIMLGVDYPSHRRFTTTELKEIEGVLSLGPNKKLVKLHIQKKFGKLTTLKDMQNIQARAKASEQKGRGDAQIVLDKLAEILINDPKASGGVVVDDQDNLSVLYFQSGLMSELFRKFPEIVLVDGTYNVNKVGMPLYSFMVENGFGHGRVSFYAAVLEESTECLEVIVHAFKKVNITSNVIILIVID